MNARRGVAGIAGAAVVTAAVAGGALLLTGDGGTPDDTRGIVAAADTTAPTTAPSASGNPPIEWLELDLPILGLVDAVLSVDGEFVAFERTDHGFDVWRSADGVSWERQPPAAPLPDDVWLHGFQWTGDRFAAVGQRFDPSGQGTGEALVATSRDGSSWELSVLEFPPRGFDDPHLREAPYVGHFAAGPDGALVVGHVEVDLDIEALLEPHAPIDRSGHSISYGSDGDPASARVEVTDLAGEVVFTATLAELGVPPETMALLQSGPTIEPVAWHTVDYATWERVEIPFGRDTFLEQLASTPDGIVAFVGGIGGQTVWTSPDGRTWIEGTSPLDDSAYLTSIRQTERGLIAVGGSVDVPRLWLSTDGVSWTQLPGGDAFAGPAGHAVTILDVAAAGAGFLVTGDSFEQPAMPDIAPVTVEHDGKRITFTQTATEATITVTDLASGEVLLTGVEQTGEPATEPPAHIRSEPDRLVLVDPATGGEIVAIPHEKLTSAFDEAFADPGFVDRDLGRPDALVWYSADGTAWDRWLATDLFGFAGFPTAAAVGDDHVLLFVEKFAAEPATDGVEGYRAGTHHLFLGTFPEG